MRKKYILSLGLAVLTAPAFTLPEEEKKKFNYAPLDHPSTLSNDYIQKLKKDLAESMAIERILLGEWPSGCPRCGLLRSICICLPSSLDDRDPN